MKSAACLFLAACALLAQSPCAIRGLVVDELAKRPLARAQVFATVTSSSDENASLPVRQVTDAQGAFCFKALAPGDYLVRASRALYVDATYGEHWPGGHGRKLTISDRTPALPIRIELMPQATISGLLLDGDGEPIQGGYIELVKARWSEQKLRTVSIDQTTTDDQGRYRFARLTGGAYFVRATPPRLHGRNGLPLEQALDESRQPLKATEGRTFYKDALSLGGATAVRLRAGEEVNLTLTLRMAEARRVAGHVSQEILDMDRRVTLQEEDTGAPGVWLSIPPREDGSFAAGGLFPDRYSVYAGPARTEIDLSNGDIEDLSLAAKPAMDLQITVYYDSIEPRPIRALTLINRTARITEEGRQIEAKFVTDNRFHLELGAGQFEIGRVGNGFPYFIREAIFDGEQLQGSIFDLKGGGRKSVELFLSSNTAAVEGRVTGRTTDAPLTVLIAPDSDPQAFRKMHSSADGQFQCTLMRGGRYRIYAFEDFDEDAWGNPEMAALLASKSQAVEIKEGGHVHVEAPLISAEEFAEAMKRTDY